MNEKTRRYIKAQMDMDRWAEVKNRISNGLCIGCGGEPDLKLYVHFCNQCILEAGVKIEWVEGEIQEGSDREKDWLSFISRIIKGEKAE